MKMRKNISTTLTRMTRAEEQFMRNYFLAPVVRGRGVRVKIAGVICEMRVEPANFVGFGIFLPISHKQAMLDRRATMLQRSAYLELFPRVQMIVCHHQDGATIVTPANRSDSRFKIDGAVELNLAADVTTFDGIIARFDGAQFWFDQIDPGADPSIAAHLRQALAQMTSPKLIERRGLSSAQIEVYDRLFQAEIAMREDAQRREPRRRIREALAHGGASLRDLAEHGDTDRVKYDVNGSRHVSLVRKNDLTILSAGICLSGMDRQFDLASVVGVLREARRIGRRF